MPEIIYGRNHSLREEVFFSRVKAAAESGGALVITPDQYSFELDKRLYEYMGARLFNSVQTMGISRLCGKICRTLGGSRLENADDNAKLIAMYKAQSRLRGEGRLEMLSRSLLRPSFVSECISLFGSLTHAGATPETLHITAESTLNGSPKLKDLALIFAEYNAALEEAGLRGSVTESAAAAKLARENRFFAGKNVFFEAFTRFSADEFELVKSVLSCCQSAVFSLVCGESEGGSDPFAETVRTRAKIEEAARDCNLRVKLTPCGGCGRSPALEHINGSLWKYRPEKRGSQGAVKLVSAADPYEEAEYVCAEIHRLTREEGLRYADIAVICGGLEENSQLLSGAAERYELPYYIDTKTSALTSVPAKYLMSLLEAALTREYRTEDLLRVAKSPLSTIFDYEANYLEEFCIKWSVDGDMWKAPFAEATQNPAIEKTRAALITPLEKFRAACKDATAAEICRALFELLDEMEMSKQIYSAVKAASDENELEVTRAFKQIWLGIVGAIKAIYEDMGGEKISLRAFSELIRLMLDGIKIAAPPQRSDCVRFADAERSRISGVKALFIIGADDGVFPRGASASGLLNEAETAALAKDGAELDFSPAVQLDSERMNVYEAVTAPSERLYICCHNADRTGTACAKSQLFAMTAELFEDDISVNASALGQEFYCATYRSAFYSCLQHSKDKTQAAANVRLSLKGSAEYSERLEYAAMAAAQRTDKISQQTAKTLFFPKDLNISATRVSDYYKCPFSYFCKHGLKLFGTDKVQMDARYFGNIAHECLEKIMSREENGKRVYDENFTKKTDEQLAAEVSACADEYIEREMGGAFGKTLTFKFAVERLKRSVTYMAAYFREEMKRSLFLPIAFEYDLTDENGRSALAIQLADTRIQIRGKIDRADIYKSDAGTWLRIVDYKTGRQSFRAEEVYHGLDLQMLIYLLAASTGLRGEYGELRPAGIMYSHIRFVKAEMTPYELEKAEAEGKLAEKTSLARAREYKPDGLMLGDEIMPALNTDNEGIFTIYRLTAKGAVHGASTAKPVSEERLKAMERFALNKVSEMAEKIHGGEIKADPLETGGVLPCTYCDYKSMCPEPSPKNPRAVSPADKEKLESALEEIEKEIGNGGKEEN